jgi:hypothetical protein
LLDTGYSIIDTGCSMLDAGYSILDKRNKDTGYKDTRDGV